MDIKEVLFNVENKGQYTQIEPVGVIDSQEEYMALQLKYFEIIVENKLKKVLIDVRKLKFPKEVFDQANIVNYAIQKQELNIIHTFKIAIIIDESDNEIGAFYETYSVNRGINVKTFNSENEAIGWLL